MQTEATRVVELGPASVMGSAATYSNRVELQLDPHPLCWQLLFDDSLQVVNCISPFQIHNEPTHTTVIQDLIRYVKLGCVDLVGQAVVRVRDGLESREILPLVKYKGLPLAIEISRHHHLIKVAAVVANAPTRIANETLKKIYGTTPAEGRLLKLLIAGKSLREIAVSQNISPNTVRSHIKSLFIKFSVNRQVDLIQIVQITSAAFPDDRDDMESLNLGAQSSGKFVAGKAS